MFSKRAHKVFKFSKQGQELRAAYSSLQKNKTFGFTLVELIVGLMLAVIVIGAAGALIVYGSNFFSHTANRSQQQADVTNVSDYVAEELRLATSVQVIVGQPLPAVLAENQRILYVGDEDGALAHTGYLYTQDGTKDSSPRNYYGVDWYNGYTIALDYSVAVQSEKPKVFDVAVTAYNQNGNSTLMTSEKSFQLINSAASSHPYANEEVKSTSTKFYILYSLVQKTFTEASVTADGDNAEDWLKEWIVPQTGYYKIECWGANGGDAQANKQFVLQGGTGGYAYGVIKLTEGEKLYLAAGGAGSTTTHENPTALGGQNGGGMTYLSSTNGSAGSGGGGSDVRIGGIDVLSRVVVAGGGGGAAANSAGNNKYAPGGAGGGYEGLGGTLSGSGEGGTQSAGGYSSFSGGVGSFGQGGSYPSGQKNAGGGGGGGWYGGGAGFTEGDSIATGGGSGFVWTKSVTSIPAGYKLSSLYQAVEFDCLDGNASGMVNKPSNGDGGYVRISYVGDTYE